LVEDPAAKLFICMRNIPAYIKNEMIMECPELAPSDKLANNYRLGLIDHCQFYTNYYNELKSPTCQKLMKSILDISKNYDIYIVNINKDARSLLVDILRNLK
jgi:uncharacterized protein YeaO (DUF488 family)